MSLTTAYRPINLSYFLLENTRQQAEQNRNEVLVNNYENTNVFPSFRIYNRNKDLTPKIVPDYKYKYKNKSIYQGYIDKPSQTENDEIGVNTEALNRLFGYTHYGDYLYKNKDFPEKLKHKTQPKNYLYDSILD